MFAALVAYMCGLLAVYNQEIAFFVITALAQLILGPVIFIYHTKCDQKVPPLTFINCNTRACVCAGVDGHR